MLEYDSATHWNRTAESGADSEAAAWPAAAPAPGIFNDSEWSLAMSFTSAAQQGAATGSDGRRRLTAYIGIFVRPPLLRPRLQLLDKGM